MKNEIQIEKIANGFLVSGGKGRFFSATEQGVTDLISDQLMKVFERKGAKYPITVVFELKANAEDNVQ